MYRIIVVDDEISTRNMIADYIGKLPAFDLKGSFRNGLAAAQYMDTHPVDIVLTDIRMPQMDGLELARYIREKFPDCAVLIISGYGEFEYARKAIMYGVSNYILKPVSLKNLTEILTIEKTKLDRRMEERLLNRDLSNEDIELFFSDLVFGRIVQKEELESRFACLKLSFPLTGRGGRIFKIASPTAQELGRWSYGHEKLYLAFVNILRMELKGCFVSFLGGGV